MYSSPVSEQTTGTSKVSAADLTFESVAKLPIKHNLESEDPKIRVWDYFK